MTIVTVDDLTLAIKNSIDDSHAMVEEQAYELAHHVLNFFGYSDRIIDNVLEAQDRNAFYILEDADILTTEREETTLYDGREWRIHYWVFKRDKIDELMSKPAGSDKDDDVEQDFYKTLDDEVWARNK